VANIVIVFALASLIAVFTPVTLWAVFFTSERIKKCRELIGITDFNC